MFWYSLITGILSLALVCVASMKLHTELQRKANIEYATKRFVGRLTILPMGVSGAGALVFAWAILYHLPYSTASFEPETIGLLVIGVGAGVGLLITSVGWLINRSRRSGWVKRSDHKCSVWDLSILLYAVATIAVAAVACVDWLTV